MSRYLFLLRHGSAAEKQHQQADKERNLTSQGLKDVITVSHYLKKQNYTVDFVVTSPAQRALDSAQAASNLLLPGKNPVIIEDIYNASLRTLLTLTQHFEEDFKHILLVGHNPHISYFAEYLTKSEIGEMVPGGLVIIKFTSDRWNNIGEGAGTLENYIHPGIIE